jgi:DNA-binding XRE family transcriptional regulator
MMPLGSTIRAIRQRLGKTMVEFAELIGCKQSTVSRYEAGKLVPGRSVLILLLQLARGSERPPVMNALGVTRAAAASWSQRSLATALQTFENQLSVARAGRGRGAPGAALAGFARAARRVLLSGRPVDPALVRIVQHWLAHGSDPRALAHFRQAASFLEVQLRLPGGRRSKG